MNMEGAMPAISVALSVYNGAAYLAPAIESVLTQTFADFEFLVLDDGSDDETRAIAEGYAARDSRIRVISRENRGLVASLNQLFGEARAPLVARFDADDLCRPERFARQIAFLQAHPDHGLVGSATLYIDASGGPAANPQIERPTTHEEFLANLEDGPLVCHSAVMVRRNLVREAGGYRAAYVHAEDYDLWLRLSRVTRLHNLPECLLDYRVSPDQVSARHMIAQARHAAIAWLAHCALLAGGRDPTEGLAALPPLEDLDALLGPGSAAYVRRRVVARALYAPEALTGEGWDALLGHIADAGASPPLWRLAARLLRAGRPLHAARTALELARRAA
jgi:glycosyltransferase involved in cell wall biosynthesis